MIIYSFLTHENPNDTLSHYLGRSRPTGRFVNLPMVFQAVSAAIVGYFPAAALAESLRLVITFVE
jgi:hypothetical protein